MLEAPWQLFERYLDGVAELRLAVEGLTARQLRARPVAGMWSILEVLCHLADSDALFVDRMKRVIAEERPLLQFADPDQYVSALAYDVRDAQEEIELLGLMRRQMARILREQPIAAWARIGVHSRDGERTLEQLLQKAVSHLEHHLKFIREKRELLLQRQ